MIRLLEFYQCIKNELNQTNLIARRIVCNLNINQQVNTGDRYGIIKFGSRVDLFLPKYYKSMVVQDQLVIGGETIISNPDQIHEIKSSFKK